MKNITVASLTVLLFCCFQKIAIGQSTDLTTLDPGSYDSTWWNRAPYRLVQTNLREIDAGMDVEAYVQSMVDASANIVLLNVGGIVANYPTQLPFQYKNPNMKGDLVGDIIFGLHAKDIRVIGRFDFSKINETLAAQKPEWLYVSAEGKNVNYNGQVHTCPNGGYQQEYGKEILKEAINKYPLDGVFFNMIGYQTSDYSGNYYGICHCENCKQKFRDSTGYALPKKEDMNDPVFREYNAFKKSTSEKLFKEIGDHIKDLDSAIMINTYSDAGVDMIASESSSDIHSGYEWNYSATDNTKRVLGSYTDRSPGNLLIYFQAIGYRHVGTSPNLAKVWMLENMLNGAPLGFVVIGTLVNYEDRVFIPTLQDLYGFHKTNEKLFTNLQAVNKIALIRGQGDEYKGLIKLLTESHIMYDIIDPAVLGTERVPRKLEDYEAIILGNVVNMDDELVTLIDGYVENGGKLLTTGFTATKDAFGSPMTSLRLQSLAVEPSYEPFQQAKSTYLKISDADKVALGEEAFKDFSIMMMYSDFLKVQAKSGVQTLMKFMPETMFGPPEKSYYTPENLTDYPGVISHAYGKGKSAFIPWQLGAQYHLKGHYMHKILFEAALDKLLDIERTLVTDGPALVEITHLANRNGAFEWLGLINHSGQVGATLGAPVPIYNTKIRFKSVKPIREIMLMRAGTSLDFKQSNGWVEVTVPQLDDFEMVVGIY